MKISRDSKGLFVKGHKTNLGRKHTQESREKMSAIAKRDKRIPPYELLRGVPLTEKHRIKLSKNNGRHWLGKKLSISHRLKISKAKRGEKSHFWKGGITAKNIIIRESIEYAIWRTAVFERDNYICISCSARNGNSKSIFLHAHHIKRFAEFPELRFVVDNGQTLCDECHKATGTYGRRKLCI